jgi:predicted nucleic acid-binding protein
VADEVLAGRSRGLHLPDIARLDWVTVRPPASAKVLRLATDLGPGEAEVLALALETTESIAVLDDALARRAALTLGIRLTGTLGLLLDAKRKGLVRVVTPVLDQLQDLRFRLSPHTRAAVMKLAGELS